MLHTLLKPFRPIYPHNDSYIKKENTFRMIIKKDAKAKKRTLVLLFRELNEFVKKEKLSDTSLLVTVG